MKQCYRGLLAGLTMLAVPHSASAAPVIYSFAGSIIAGQDFDHLFGDLPTLAGLSFTAAETFDPARAGSSWNATTGSGASDQTGGFATVTLTINGIGRTFSGSNSSLSSGVGQFHSEVQNDFDEIGFNVASGLIKADYTIENRIGGLSEAYAGHYTLKNSAGSQIIWANFTVEGLSVVSAVPLPASAPLFGAGLLGLAALRVRRRRATASV